MLASVHKYVTNVVVVGTLRLLVLTAIVAGCAGGHPGQAPLRIAVANELDAHGRLLRQENQPQRADEMAARRGAGSAVALDGDPL